jgi:hypothetical protein
MNQQMHIQLYMFFYYEYLHISVISVISAVQNIKCTIEAVCEKILQDVDHCTHSVTRPLNRYDGIFNGLTA